MIEPGDLHANAQAILTQIEAEATNLSFSLPERRYTTVGGAVFDCEQVSVSVMSVQTGVVSSEGNALQIVGNCPPVWNASFEVAIVLCASEAVEGPRGQILPDVAKVEADSAAMSAAYAILVNAAEALVTDAGPVTCTIQLGQPQGGLIAAVAQINANLWLGPGV